MAPRRLGVATLVLLLGLVGAVGILHPVPAHATQGLTEVGSATWTVRPARGELEVRAEITVTHTVPDEPDGSYTYWDEYGTFLPYEPDTIEVTWDGTPVTPRVDPADGWGADVSWALPGELRFGQTRTAVLTATFSSGAPRTEQFESPRIDRGYVLAWVHGFGDTSDVTVEMPASLQGTPPEGWEATTDGNQVRWTTSGWSGPGLDAVLATGDVRGGRVQRVRVGGHAVRIVPMATDPAWGTAMADFVEEAIPTLRRLTGGEGLTSNVTIRESAQPELAGWGGWYQEDDDTILVGEAFDRELWTHELSHHWFNGREFDDVWLIEGLAEYTAARASRTLGFRTADPGRPDPDLVLDNWSTSLSPIFVEPGTREFQDLALRHYDGAHALVRSMAQEIGRARFNDVVTALITERSAFPGPGDERVDVVTSWHELVDLLRAIGGLRDAGALIVEHVDPTVADEVRANARAWRAWEAFTSFEWSHADWVAPLDVRRAMQAWDYERAELAMEQAAGLRGEVEGVEAAVAAMGIGPPSFRRHWEGETLAALEDALADVRFSMQIIQDLHDDADAAGIELPTVVEELGFDQADATSLRVARVREALDVVEAAVTAPRPDGPLATVGLLGQDPEAAVTAAREALAADDLDGARLEARAALDTWDGAGTTGFLRIAMVVLPLALVGAVLAWVVWRRRDDEALPAEVLASSPPLTPPTPARERPRPTPPPAPPVPPAPRLDDADGWP